MNDEERFNFALTEILNHEGSYTDDSNDPGGPTNFGITQKDLESLPPGIIAITNVKNLTKEDAAKYYKICWWDKYNYNGINSLKIATKVFDLAVNLGPIEAHKLVQRALYFIGYRVVADGVLGPKTISIINDVYSKGHEAALDCEIIEEADFYYRELVEKNPKLLKFLHGWLNRAQE